METGKRLGRDAIYLATSSDNFPDSLVVEVVPVRDLDLSPKSRVDRLHGDLGE